MFDEEEYGSDSSDDDYVPVENADSGSEKDSGEEEDVDALIDDASEDTKQVKGKKRVTKKSKKKDETFVRKRQGGIRLDGDEELAAAAKEEAAEDAQRRKEMEKAMEEEQEAKRKEQEKKKSDSLWASFLSDVPSRPVPKKPVSSGLGSLSSIVKSKTESKPVTATVSSTNKTEEKEEKPASTKADKIMITKEYDFAGEVVKITKEVDANSKEAKAEQKAKEKEAKSAAAPPSCGPSLSGLKRPGGGLGSVLGKIGKKPKMGTLQKSKLDWDAFKEKEGISEELSIHNRGKDGFIERQAFLNRTDHREFERERMMRLNSKR